MTTSVMIVLFEKKKETDWVPLVRVDRNADMWVTTFVTKDIFWGAK
jgi:hypothetical protein